MIKDENNFQVIGEIHEALNEATIKQLQLYFDQEKATYVNIKFEQKPSSDGSFKLIFTGYECKKAKRFLMPKINDLIQLAIPDDWTNVIKKLDDPSPIEILLTEVAQCSETWNKVVSIFNQNSTSIRQVEKV